MCQLHGGDIGVSSKEGDGSTFGFFFKVRQSDGSSTEDGRPSLSSRSNSENPSTPNQQAQAPRPGYSRANSNLQDIKERQNEQGRTEIKLEAKESESESKSKKDENNKSGSGLELDTLTSHSGVDTDDVDQSLKNPPTEYFPEAHPEANADSRYQQTESVAKQLTPPLEGHDGRIPYAESGESKRQEAVADKAHNAQSSQRSEDKRTLLLVEDNLINQKVLRRQLQSRGFEVFVANNGQEAIDAVFERGKTTGKDHHNRNYFDCILMDQEMPIKDGNQATLEIRQLQDAGKAGYSKILGVSANVREAQRDSMREAGMDDLISKPFKVDDLVKKIEGLTIGGKSGKGEEGKLAEEADRLRKGEDLDKGQQLTEDEKKIRDEKKRGDAGEEEGEEKPEDKQQKPQERREEKQAETREKRGGVDDKEKITKRKKDQDTQKSDQKESKEKQGKKDQGSQDLVREKEKVKQGLEKKG